MGAGSTGPYSRPHYLNNQNQRAVYSTPQVNSIPQRHAGMPDESYADPQSTKTKVTPIDFSTVRGAEGEYLLSLLRDIVKNPGEYLYWHGYLAQAGPPALRFNSQKYVVSRHDLIPLATPNGNMLNMDELFPSNDIFDLAPQSGPKEILRPKYTGHVKKLSRDDILRMLSLDKPESNDLPVRFQPPAQLSPSPPTSRNQDFFQR